MNVVGWSVCCCCLMRSGWSRSLLVGWLLHGVHGSCMPRTDGAHAH